MSQSKTWAGFTGGVASAANDSKENTNQEPGDGYRELGTSNEDLAMRTDILLQGLSELTKANMGAAEEFHKRLTALEKIVFEVALVVATIPEASPIRKRVIALLVASGKASSQAEASDLLAKLVNKIAGPEAGSES